jgi:hypothetical protein
VRKQILKKKKKGKKNNTERIREIYETKEKRRTARRNKVKKKCGKESKNKNRN